MTFTSTPQDSPHSIELGDQGQVVLPESIRHQLNLQSGDRLILTVESDGSLRLTSLRSQIQKLQGMFKDIAPGVSLADELIGDRRREAQQEAQS
ncbi:MAG: AbrB/MazE/SpoVT family DNA-binding domain-containing protein [Cyanobacteria bacterium CRU_2_1]|nr:AbrB/MazE/SpoVT family DNA-binding domain-containing protein [Cyanobacteria bacterium RU_5_0]NJR63893.1 AbrB/MazE/SpoVT family DNA-binding domain-containing protein [Cyanobacteria bacterium CRU_2_1]